MYGCIALRCSMWISPNLPYQVNIIYLWPLVCYYLVIAFSLAQMVSNAAIFTEKMTGFATVIFSFASSVSFQCYLILMGSK